MYLKLIKQRILKLKSILMKLVLILLLLMCGCRDPFVGLKSTKYYRIAEESLLKEGIKRTTLLSKEDMDLQKYIVFGKDTIDLVQSKLLFCLMDTKAGYIYVFQFYINYGYKRYTCTKEWDVISQLEQVGEGIIYPDIKRKVALDTCTSCPENPKRN